MELQTGDYRVGVGGWEHETFDACFYPAAHMESADKLRYFSRYFDSVEVRSTFWDDTLGGEEARSWLASVSENPRFLFSVKLHSSFTHRKEISPDLARRVRGMLYELERANRLGALLLQFPYAFTNISAHRRHLQKLGELFPGFPVHVETRNASWDEKDLVDQLKGCGLSPVSVDLPPLKHFPGFLTETIGETAYLRLHGRNEKGWLANGMDTRYDYCYNEKEVHEIARKAKTLARNTSRVMVLCNNTTNGGAILNALQISAQLQRRGRISLPERAIEAFPDLQDIREVASEGQLSLSVDPYRRAM
jgi:uncharacterized protein YecE (DUF72 family)